LWFFLCFYLCNAIFFFWLQFFLISISFAAIVFIFINVFYFHCLQHSI
jgi:hypothetical protein